MDLILRFFFSKEASVLCVNSFSFFPTSQGFTNEWDIAHGPIEIMINSGRRHPDDNEAKSSCRAGDVLQQATEELNVNKYKQPTDIRHSATFIQ